MCKTIPQAIEQFNAIKFQNLSMDPFEPRFYTFECEYFNIKGKLDVTVESVPDVESNDSYSEEFSFRTNRHVIIRFRRYPRESTIILLDHNLRRIENGAELANHLIKTVMGIETDIFVQDDIPQTRYIYNSEVDAIVLDLSSSLLRCEHNDRTESSRDTYIKSNNKRINDIELSPLYNADTVYDLIVNKHIFSTKLLTINDNQGLRYYLSKCVRDEYNISTIKDVFQLTSSYKSDFFDIFAKCVIDWRFRKSMYTPMGAESIATKKAWGHVETFPLLYLNQHRDMMLQAMHGGEYFRVLSTNEIRQLISGATAETLDVDVFDSINTERRYKVHLDDCLDL